MAPGPGAAGVCPCFVQMKPAQTVARARPAAHHRGDPPQRRGCRALLPFLVGADQQACIGMPQAAPGNGDGKGRPLARPPGVGGFDPCGDLVAVTDRAARFDDPEVGLQRGGEVGEARAGQGAAQPCLEKDMQPPVSRGRTARAPRGPWSGYLLSPGSTIIAENSASAARSPDTRAVLSNFQIRPRPRCTRTCSSSTSPGTTWRRKRVLSSVMK